MSDAKRAEDATPLLFHDAEDLPEEQTVTDTPASEPTSSPDLPPDLALFRVLRDDGTADPEHDPGLSGEDAVRLYEQMLLIRNLDTRCLRLQRQGRIAFYGTSTGQEAATVGSSWCIGADDWLFPALREGGAALLRGMSVSRYIAQLMGNSHDEQKGHQQPMHFSYRDGNHVSLSSPIATQVPQAVGAARAAQIRGDGKVVLAYMGDGATSEHDFHTAMTFAGVWRCPVVLVCQNNHWAISVPLSQQTASPSIAVKARGYGMPGIRVDGNDLLAVVAATRTAVERAREGKGPTFLELVTYRRQGHSSSDDPTVYRDQDEVVEWEQKDPIERMRRHLVQRGIWDEAKEAAAQERQNEMISKEIQEAEKAAPPALETLIEDVYGAALPTLDEQLDEVRPFFEVGGVAEGEFPL